MFSIYMNNQGREYLSIFHGSDMSYVLLYCWIHRRTQSAKVLVSSSMCQFAGRDLDSARTRHKVKPIGHTLAVLFWD